LLVSGVRAALRQPESETTRILEEWRGRGGELVLAPEDLNRLVSSVLARCLPTFGGLGLEVLLDEEQRFGELSCDGPRVAAVLEAVLHTAAHCFARGAPVQVSVTGGPGRAVVSIRSLQLSTEVSLATLERLLDSEDSELLAARNIARAHAGGDLWVEAASTGAAFHLGLGC
jgi:hypothetical protein